VSFQWFMSLAGSNVKPVAPQNEFAGKWPVFRAMGKGLKTAKATYLCKSYATRPRDSPTPSSHTHKP
jgi:hypothetical protein